MAATGRDGAHRQAASSNSDTTSSSESGTIVSTTCTSSASRLSSASMEAALHLELGIHDDEDVSREENEEGNSSVKMQMKHVNSMVHEFFGALSANYCGISVLERWLMELGVGWVLHLADGASARKFLHTSVVCSWIRALAEIVHGYHTELRNNSQVKTIDSMKELLFPDPDSLSVCEQEEEPEAASCFPDQIQFARFIQETMLKMLAFVDFMVTLNPNGVPELQQKINILLCVRVALSNASFEIEESFLSTPSAQVELIADEMANLLSAKDGKAGEAIWSTLEEIRTRIMDSMEDSSGSQAPQGSSDIHKVTLSVMGHIKFLLDNYSSVSPIVSQAASLGKYVPQIRDQPHLDTMIMEMTSCLQEKLLKMSGSFPDEGLRFLFLLNNSNYIREKFQSNTRYSSLQVYVAALSGKVEAYMESYLQVSWAPVLSCLLNSTPLCLFGKYYYPLALPKLEFEFQKAYTTQKLWKVPDPELRISLRTAITEKIIPGYTKYIEDNNITTPRFGPQQLEEMLQELFEG